MDQAQTYYERALQRDPACVGALVGMAYVHEAQEQGLAIRQKLNQAYHFDETHPRLVRAIGDFERRYREELVPPRIQVLRPTDGSRVPRAAAVSIEVRVTDDRSGVARVQVRDGNRPIRRVGGGDVFQFLWDTRGGPRERTLEIYAWDRVGNVSWTILRVTVGP